MRFFQYYLKKLVGKMVGINLFKIQIIFCYKNLSKMDKYFFIVDMCYFGIISLTFAIVDSKAGSLSL